MSREFMAALAVRHKLEADELIELWEERSAIRQYVDGFSRQAAELFAIGDVEQMLQIGLHAPETIRRLTSGPPRFQRRGEPRKKNSKPGRRRVRAATVG